MVRPLPVLPALALLAASCVSLEPTDERPSEVVVLQHSELGEMTNVSVCGDVWLGSGATRADLGIASRRGVETLLDLRLSTAELEVEALAAELGLEYMRAVPGPEGFEPRELDRLLVVLGRPDRGPVLLLCDDGSQSAIVFAVHRAYNDGRTVEDALEEARRAGLKPGAGERAVLEQLERLGLEIDAPDA